MFLQHLILDLFFDIVNYVDQNKKNIQIVLSIIILGASCGYAGAKLMPSVDVIPNQNTTDLSADLLSAGNNANGETDPNTVPKTTDTTTPETTGTEEVPPVVEISEIELQEIYTQVMTKDDPTICQQKLTGDYVDNCIDQYWNIKASTTFNPELCANIKNETVKTECTESSVKNEVKTDGTATPASNNLSDEIIQKKSEDCMKKEGAINQNVCWNSLFLSVAINNADPAKCENIKDEKTKTFCKGEAKHEVNLQLKEQAITAKDKSLCDGIDDEKIKKDCINAVIEKFLEVSAECDQVCTDKKIENLALESLDIKLCSKIPGENKEMCQSKVLAGLALQKKDSRICEQIKTETEKQACITAINKEEDLNPEVQKELYRSSDRTVPKIGDTLSDPLTESPYYSETEIESENGELSTNSTNDLNNNLLNNGEDETVNGVEDFSSVLSELEGLEDNNDNLLINTDVCKIYNDDEKRKIACEDALVLQLAIPNKDIAKCKFVQDEATRDYCELEIIGQDAVKAAEEARQKCYALSSVSAQQKCLKNSGFFTEDVESANASDCLDYADPIDRIACMRKIKK